MSWLTSLSLEQRRMRDALREARQLLRESTGPDNVDPEEMRRLALLILNGGKEA